MARVIGFGAAAGAFLALGMAPPAHADILDSIISPIVDSIAALDPAAAVDLSGATLDASAAASVDTLLHTLEQDWITSPTGIAFDHSLNTAWQDLGGSGILIGNGANGTPAENLAEAAGQAGGLLMGDGGHGATDAAGQGGVGGAAGMFGDGGGGGTGEDGGAGGAGGTGGTVLGDGGQGGDGGDGAVGGSGGDGGNAVSPFGDGGGGGKGGDSTDAGVLAALGGAGGNGGVFGNHGMVGDFGTVAGAAPGSPYLEATGSWLTNSSGQVVMMHGLNEVYKVAPYTPAGSGFGNNDAAFLAANGFNAVRVGVIWSALEPQPGVYDTAYLQSIEDTVQTLASHHIYSILDFHQDAYSSMFGGEGAPAWAVESGGAANPTLPFPLNEFFNPAETQAWDSFWANAPAPNNVGLEDNYAQMVEHVASAFNGNPNVAGIELMNEPSPGSQTVPSLLGSPFFDAQQLTPFYDQAADAVRAVDPNTPIFYEPSVVANFGAPTSLGSVDASNTVFSFHAYCELPLGSLGCFPATAIIDNAATYAQAHDVPAFMTEFGATSTQADITPSEQGADQHLMSWTEWAYSGQGDVTTTANPPSSESLVYNPAASPTGANVNTANLDTLAEPYPQVVSGTPESYSFANGTFQFSYSTEMANGSGSFGAGSPTTISVPSVEFPNGYDVSVTGGHVVSGPDAAQLVIASDPGASTVSVTVSPAA
jgi:endoglycosylceramidase